MANITLNHASCLDWLAGYDGPLFDACVTDPPYHLTSIVKRFGGKNAAEAKVGATGAYARAAKGFMGKEWDGGDIAFRPETWCAVYDALKPGAHLVAFSGTRTYHRMACAIEDAGFEIRDCLFWAYGSGFPKSHDVSKGIDKAAGAEREVVGRGASGRSSLMGGLANRDGEYGHAITSAATPEAEQWQGWGTALKPSFEPVLSGAKPLTVEQHFAIILHELTAFVAEIDLWLNSPVPDAARRFTDTLAKCEGVASIVLDSAKIRSLESIGIASSAVQSFTFKPLASLDLIRTKECSALSHVRQNGSVGSASGRTIHSGAAEDILALILATSTSAMTENISASTVLSWLNISDAILRQANKFTIETASKLTTALKILRFSLRENTIEGTGRLTPNAEPICLARKPLSEKTVAANVLKHGTGAINIDGCRVEISANDPESFMRGERQIHAKRPASASNSVSLPPMTYDAPKGRWPANLIHDGSDEVLAGFPETGAATASIRNNNSGMGIHDSEKGTFGKGAVFGGYDDNGGSAARFFYSAKAGPLDRIGTAHATVKPVDLMRWLCRLVTPPGGHILEPFAGSGTTGIAAMAEGFDCTMIELEADHVADIERKLAFLRGEGALTFQEHNHAKLQRPQEKPLGGLFGEVA